MLIWRITRKPFLAQALVGVGAKKYGGRWNSKSVAVVYASETLELAMLEALVHVDMDLLPKDMYQMAFEVEERLIGPVTAPLPKGWGRTPPYEPKVQAIGDAWIRNESSLGLRVPASVLPSRSNILLNPAHSKMASVREVERRPLPWPSRVTEFLKGMREAGKGKKMSRNKK
jgi:RES domain-containing protein